MWVILSIVIGQPRLEGWHSPKERFVDQGVCIEEILLKRFSHVEDSNQPYGGITLSTASMISASLLVKFCNTSANLQS